MTWVAEKFAQAVSWNLNTSLHFPSRERIAEAFHENEFERESRPLWGDRRLIIISLFQESIVACQF